MNGFVKTTVRVLCIGFVSFLIFCFLVGLYFFCYYNICPYIKNSMRNRHYYEKVLRDKYGIDFGIKSMSSPFDSFFDFDGSLGVDYKYNKKIKAYPLSNPSILFSARDDMKHNDFSDDFIKEYVGYNVSLELEDLFLRFGVNIYSRVVIHCNSIVYNDNDYDISFDKFYDSNDCSSVSVLLLVDKVSVSNRNQIYDVISKFNGFSFVDDVEYEFYFVSDNYLEKSNNIKYHLDSFESGSYEKAIIYLENGIIKDSIGYNMDDIDFN